MEAQLVSLRRVLATIEDYTQDRTYQKNMATIANIIFEGEKKLHTEQSFARRDETWEAPEGHAMRWIPYPENAIWVEHVYVNGVRLNPSNNHSKDLLTNGEFLRDVDKIWFAFIPSKVRMTCKFQPVGEDGLPMVSENHVDALAWWVIYHLDYAEYRKQKLPRRIFMDTKALKDKAMRQARGSDNMPNWMQNRIVNKRLSNMWSKNREQYQMIGNFLKD